jgi:Putative beta-barrel porin-2, OmpL-like. bbp2
MHIRARELVCPDLAQSSLLRFATISAELTRVIQQSSSLGGTVHMDKKLSRILLPMAASVLAIAVVANAQTTATPAPAAAQAPAPAPAAAAPPAPLSTFVLSGPLQWLPPATFDAGPFGKLSVNGIITGYAQGQNNPVPGDDTKQATLTNGQIFIQKADGNLQYFVQAGVYDLPALGAPFVNAQNTTNLFGPVPVAFLKLNTGKTTSWQIGALPTLIGAEGIFTYQNMNVSRGLLWFQENIVNRGIQVNQTLGKYLSASFSWNDGYYSDRYNWLTGSLTFTKGANSLAVEGIGNAGTTGYSTPTGSLYANNSSMEAVVYTYTKGTWVATGTYQHSDVPTNASIGIDQGATTNGVGVYLSKTLKSGFSLPGRFEYIKQSGTVNGPDASLLYGPGSSAISFTVTPTYQKGGFFFRTDLGVIDTNNSSGYAFGPTGTDASQFRAVGEFGFIFGDNLTK